MEIHPGSSGVCGGVSQVEEDLSGDIWGEDVTDVSGLGTASLEGMSGGCSGIDERWGLLTTCLGTTLGGLGLTWSWREPCRGSHQWLALRVGRSPLSDGTQWADDRKLNPKWSKNKMELIGVFDRKSSRWLASGKA